MCVFFVRLAFIYFLLFFPELLSWIDRWASGMVGIGEDFCITFYFYTYCGVLLVELFHPYQIRLVAVQRLDFSLCQYGQVSDLGQIGLRKVILTDKIASINPPHSRILDP